MLPEVLDKLRSVQEAAMPDSAVIERGGVTQSSTIQCRKRSAKDPRVRAIANQLGILSAGIVVFPSGSDVQQFDIVTITHALQGNSVEKVKIIDVLHSSYDTAHECVCVSEA